MDNQQLKCLKTIISTTINENHKYKKLQYIYKCNDCNHITYNASNKMCNIGCVNCGNKYYPGVTFINGSEVLNIISKNNRKYLEIKCTCGDTYSIRSDSGQRSLLNNKPSICPKCKAKALSEQSSTSTEETVLLNIYKMYIKNAELRNLEFNLTYEEFKLIIFNTCYYCGNTGEFYSKTYSKTHNIKRVGVDRVDNTKGYTVENSIPCCKTCNIMKGSLTYKEFTEKLIEIKEFLNKKFNDYPEKEYTTS